MIIDGKSIAITFVIVSAAFVYGLKMIRKFALGIAQENHDAVKAFNREEEEERAKRERREMAVVEGAGAKAKAATKSKKTSYVAETAIPVPKTVPFPVEAVPFPVEDVPSTTDNEQKPFADV